MALFYVESTISIKLFKEAAKVGNPPPLNSATGDQHDQSRPKSHTFSVILVEFAPQPRWRQKPWKGLYVLKILINLRSVN